MRLLNSEKSAVVCGYLSGPRPCRLSRHVWPGGGGGPGRLLLPSLSSSSARPCNIYAAGGTPCVAAYSTVRALYRTYHGPLYQVTRVSDGTKASIGTLPDGYANAAAQNSFCAGTVCTITRIYDQSSFHNDLGVGPIGGNGGPDAAAIANALPVKVGGHPVYGVSVQAGRGLPQRRHGRCRDRKPAAGRVHGDQRHARGQRLLLRLRQRRDVRHRHRQRPHGRDQLRHRVLVLAVYRVRALGPGRPGERPVRRRQRLRPGQQGQLQHVRDRHREQQRHDQLRDQGRQRAVGRREYRVQRAAPGHRRVHPDAPGGRRHPGDRRRQQQRI